MDEDSKRQTGEENLNSARVSMDRRNFLLSLKKWSKIVIGGALVGSTLLNSGTETQAASWVNGSGGGGAWGNHGGGGAWGNHGGGGGTAWANHGNVWANRGNAWANGGGGTGWANRGGVWANRGAVWGNSGSAWVNRF